MESSFGSSRLVTWLAQTPIPVALFVAGTTVLGLTLIGAPIHPVVVALVLGITYSSYAIDRLVDGRSGAGPSPAEGSLIASASVVLVVTLSIAYALGGLVALVATLAFPSAVVAYCAPWLRGIPWLDRRGIRRVKDIPYTKNLYTATCTTSAAVWAAWLSGIHQPGRLLVLVGALFLSNLVNTVACDLGDVAEDRAEGIPTFPVRFGRWATARALRWLSYTWASIVVLGAAAGLLSPVALLAALGVIPKLAYLDLLAHHRTPPLAADLVPDLTDAGIGACTFAAALALGA